MYSVSEDYLQAIRAPVRTERLLGSVTLTDGTVVDFGPENLMSGSVTIDNQCVSGEELQFGCVYLGQVAFQLKTELSRYKLYGGKVKLTYGIQIPGIGWYDMPLGVYTVGEAERSSVYVDIKAYDNVIRLERSFDTDRLSGNMFEMLRDICGRCGLIMAQTAEELADNFPNTTQSFDLLPTDGCETYRDCVGVLAQMMAAFATVDRSGRLLIRAFKTTPEAALAPSERNSATVADYECGYAGLKISGGENAYYCERNASGLTMEITDAPLFGKGTDERNTPMAESIMDVLEKIKYTPATVTMPGDPAIEPGDRLLLMNPPDGAGGGVECQVTHIVWKFRGKETLKSVGKNPYLMTAKNATDKALDKALSQSKTDSSTFYIYGTKNKEELRVTDDEMTVATLDFATVATTRIAFVMTSTHSMTMDGNVLVRIYIDDELYHSYTDYEARGQNTLTVQFNLDVRGNARMRLKVTMQYQLFISDRRIDAADRLTLWNYSNAIVWSMASSQGKWSGLRLVSWNKVKESTWDDLPKGGMGSKTWDDLRYGKNSTDPTKITYTTVQPDETHGAIEIAAEALTGVLFGRGLAATDVWDGTITVQDYFGAIEMEERAFNITDTMRDFGMQPDLQVPIDGQLGESIGLMQFQPTFAVDAITASTGMAVEQREENIIYMSGTHEGTADIDIGEDYYSVPVRITFICDDDTRLWASADSGINWLTWNGTRWSITSTGNTAAELNDLGESEWHEIITYGKIRFRWEGTLQIIKMELHGHRTVLDLAVDDAAYDTQHIVRDGNFRMITNYTYDSTLAEIDTGKMAVLEIPASEFQEIEGVELK